MTNSKWLLSPWLTVLLAAALGAAESKPSVIRAAVSLVSKGKTITAVELQNTHSRSYGLATGGGHSQRCELDKETLGVIWLVTCEGKEIPVEAIVLEDETGRAFRQVCWVQKSSGIFGNNILLLAAGPDETKEITVRFGDATTKIAVAR